MEERVARLHAPRLIDLHFDLPLGLFWNRARGNVVTTDFLPEFDEGNVGLLGVAVYVEDKYLPNDALRIGLDQIALLCAEVEVTPRLMLCKTFADIRRAESEG